MMALIYSQRMAYFLLLFVQVGLLLCLAFAAATYSTGLELLDGEMYRYCSLSGGVCTGV